ncbi:dTMP kinase [Patescibacteria group bacterium]|nr:dTMP kinase [Patescibacteria group bacterium]MBU4274683.1 dTMP kinase [Patescibacteria group bacterium]MBU4367729.1 dTMP kinase [Patescibacteria group bacterium]MBU4461821.1 dTMP kinase [Patescibacteria group bacterium]MCG2700048.1 dTMP kinase [Candidatus Parcubacteria bacterium]
MNRDYPGLFVTIEGGHGCGKTTLTNLLKKKLEELGYKTVISVDQKGTAIGQKLRRINLEENNNVAILTEALLIAAARHQNVVEVIKPALLGGKVVIGERYNDAFYAFQVFARGLSVDFVDKLSQVVADGINPAITILLDIDPRIALARIASREKHRIEKESIVFHERVRIGYLEQAKRFPKRIKVIDASVSVGEVFNNMWKEVENLLGEKYHAGF